MNSTCGVVFAVFTAFLASMAHAARPMVTDDARLTDEKACQVESWARRNADSREYWALPACNPTGNLELTFGGAIGDDERGRHTSDIVIQGKTLFRPLAANSWGLGVVAGNVRHPAIHVDSNGLGDLYAYVPASFSFLDNRFVLHVNVGTLRLKAPRRERTTWGIGGELAIGERSWLVAETFGQDTGRPFFQFGVRYWAMPNRVQVDTTYGNRFGHAGAERWFTIGLRLISPPFLP